MDKLTKEAIGKFRKQFIRDDGLMDKYGWENGEQDVLGNIIINFIVKWLSKAFKAGLEEGKTYQGKNKRVWYQKGFEEGRKKV